jgi:class 3 adenylate cyclase
VGLKQDLQSEVHAIFHTSWNERDGKKVPEPEDVKLGNDAVKLDGTVLYADLSDSTGLVDGHYWWFAAEVYKAYLICACRVIRHNGGVITAFDGDRVMAVYLGDYRDDAAARSAMQINYAVSEIINPKIRSRFDPPHYEVKQVVGIDRGVLYAVRTGIRGSNDLVWVGPAANYAAKMCAADFGAPTCISEAVYRNLTDAATHGGDPVRNMWVGHAWRAQNKSVYCSTYWWEI